MDLFLNYLYANWITVVAVFLGLVMAFAILCRLFPTVARAVTFGFASLAFLVFFGGLGSDFVATGIRYFNGETELDRWITSLGPGSVFSVLFPIVGAAMIVGVPILLLQFFKRKVLGIILGGCYFVACCLCTYFLVQTTRATFTVFIGVPLIALLYGLFLGGFMVWVFEKISGEEL